MTIIHFLVNIKLIIQILLYMFAFLKRLKLIITNELKLTFCSCKISVFSDMSKLLSMKNEWRNNKVGLSYRIGKHK